MKKKPRAGKVKCTRCKTVFVRKRGEQVKLCGHCSIHCYRCNVLLLPSLVSTSRGNPKCLNCEIEVKSYSPIDRSKDYRLVRKYGITLREYRSIVRLQEGVCYICQRPPTTTSLAVDHKHQKGERQKSYHLIRPRVRGILCNQCNRGLAFYRDDSVRMLRAHDYLSSWLAQDVLTGSIGNNG